MAKINADLAEATAQLTRCKRLDKQLEERLVKINERFDRREKIFQKFEQNVWKSGNYDDYEMITKALDSLDAKKREAEERVEKANKERRDTAGCSKKPSKP